MSGGRVIMAGFSFGVLACLALAGSEAPEARVTLDVKQRGIQDIVAALVEASGLQVIFDPEVSCKVTVKVHETSWLTAFRASLNACGLGYEEEGNVVRIATRARLTAEAAERRRLVEEQRQRPGNRVELFRLSYARAREMAPLLAKVLSGRERVVYDERTNTLIIVD